jgi:hypothetical protein
LSYSRKRHCLHRDSMPHACGCQWENQLGKHSMAPEPSLRPLVLRLPPVSDACLSLGESRSHRGVPVAGGCTEFLEYPLTFHVVVCKILTEFRGRRWRWLAGRKWSTPRAQPWPSIPNLHQSAGLQDRPFGPLSRSGQTPREGAPCCATPSGHGEWGKACKTRRLRQTKPICGSGKRC